MRLVALGYVVLMAFPPGLAMSAAQPPPATPPAPAATPAPAAPAQAPINAKLAGHWEGAVIRTLGKDETDFTIDLAPQEGGGLSGKMTILMIGMRNKPLDKVTVDGASITFEEANEGARRVFQGKLSDDGERISGELQRGDRKTPFELDRRERAHAPAESELIDLSADSRELRQLFDQEKGTVRVLMLLSPT